MNTDIAYKDHVSTYIKQGTDVLETMDAHKLELIHTALGLSGEVGELVDAIKKHVIYNQKLDVVNVIEELGDIEFFLQDLRTKLGLSRYLVLTNNINKLERRYPSGTYTDNDAKNRRDKE